MANFDQRDTTTTRRTFTLRTPTAFAELNKMLHCAELDYRRFHGLTDDAPLYDDFMTVDVGDDEVVVFFDYPGTARKQAQA